MPTAQGTDLRISVRWKKITRFGFSTNSSFIRRGLGGGGGGVVGGGRLQSKTIKMEN